MSAPDTNLETQTKRHRGSIWGISAALIVAVLAAVGFFLWDGVPSDNQAAPTVASDRDQ
jgi:hypothetical protein